MKLLSKKSANAKCYVFYMFNFERHLAEKLFVFSLEFFSKMNIPVEYLEYYNEKYEINYGKIEKITSLLKLEQWDEIVHFKLDDKDVRDEKRLLGVEFNITRPDMFTVFLSEGINFNIESFCCDLYPIFKVQYGFSYRVKMNEWAGAYSIGDWQHSKGAEGVSRNSKTVLQHWNKNCESIKDGMIRDVYHENILSKIQLARFVNEISLEEYIRGNGKGTLKSINSELFYWSIEKEGDLNEIRKELYGSGVVF